MKYSIKVSEVRNGSENLKGLATLVLGDSFKVGNIAIMNDPNKNQLFVSMPSYKTNQMDDQGKAVYKDFFNPTTAEFRKELYDNNQAKEQSKSSIVGKINENKDKINKQDADKSAKGVEKEHHQPSRDEAR